MVCVEPARTNLLLTVVKADAVRFTEESLTLHTACPLNSVSTDPKIFNCLSALILPKISEDILTIGNAAGKVRTVMEASAEREASYTVNVIAEVVELPVPYALTDRRGEDAPLTNITPHELL